MRSTDAEFEQRVREYQTLVYRIAYSVLRNPADALDVAQDAFLRAHQKAGSLRDGEQFRHWICTIARRLALNLVRTESRRRARHERALAGPAPVADVEGIAGEHLFVERVRAEIDRLPGHLREVMQFCAIDDLDQRTVAQMLGIPEGTVRSRLHLARKHLVKALDR